MATVQFLHSEQRSGGTLPTMATSPADVPAMTDIALPTDDPIAATRLWLERIVIGLNLCPFAKAVYVKDQVRFVLSDATTPEALVEIGRAHV